MGNTGRKQTRGTARTLYELLFCLIACVNLLFVFFDFTYLAGVPYTHFTFRDFYLRTAPDITRVYDPVKDITAHRTTDAYLKLVDELERAYRDEPAVPQAVARQPVAPDAAVRGPGAREPDAPLSRVPELLAQLTQQSQAMIDVSPFQIARKDGTLEIIKDRMRDYVKRKDLDAATRARIGDSSKRSFEYFWSAGNLTPATRAAELDWFKRKIRPLFEQNYFRHIGHDGELIDRFYLLDLAFVAFFALDFFVRWILAISARRYRAWYLFPVVRWFEAFNLLFPHHMAWLRLGRVIPFFVRMRENGFIPGEGILPGLVHDNAGVIAEEISGLVLIRILAQVQAILREADLTQATPVGEGALGEVQALLDTQTEVLAHGMVPAIQPQIADLVRFSIDKALEPWLFSPIGGVMRLALISVHKTVRDGLAAALAADEGRDRLAGILRTSTRAIINEISAPGNLRAMQGDVDRLLGSVIVELENSLKNQADARG